MRARGGANDGERGDSQPGGAHRHEGDSLDRFIGENWAVLEDGAEAVAIEIPFGNPFRFRGQVDRSGFGRERKIVGGPVGTVQCE